MSQAGEAKDPIEDVCWELFGGACGVLSTKDEMAACPRKIRTCDAFVPQFRKAIALLRPAGGKPAEKPADKPTEKAPDKPNDKPAAKASTPGPGPAAAHGNTPTPVAGGVRFGFTGEAKSVAVAGSFTEWKPVALTRDGDGHAWHGVLPVPAGEHTYKLVVDDKWIKPPEAPAYAPDGQGAENGLLKV